MYRFLVILTCRQLCAPEQIADIQALIDNTINEDITYQNQPLDLRNQRTYAVKVSRTEASSIKAFISCHLVRGQWPS